jgi:hypothetical protein
MDGYILHVNIDFMQRAHVVGLHLLILPTHYSHAMQPLDMAVFKPLTGAFLVYRNVLMLQKNGIYPLDPSAMEGSMGPSATYKNVDGKE